MRLIMAVSKDGFVARSERDDMSWLGQGDKALFRALTATGGGLCCVGRRSARNMPHQLAGRELVVLGTDHGMPQIDHMRYGSYREAWLLGGQELALKALALTQLDCMPDQASGKYPPMIGEVHLCRSDRCAFTDDERYADRITPMLVAYGLTPALSTTFADVRHEVWRLTEAMPATRW